MIKRCVRRLFSLNGKGILTVNSKNLRMEVCKSSSQKESSFEEGIITKLKALDHCVFFVIILFLFNLAYSSVILFFWKTPASDCWVAVYVPDMYILKYSSDKKKEKSCQRQVDVPCVDIHYMKIIWKWNFLSSRVLSRALKEVVNVDVIGAVGLAQAFCVGVDLTAPLFDHLLLCTGISQAGA